MSGERRVLTFAVTTADPDRWTSKHREASAESPTYGDWVVEQLAATMRDAGNAYIAANPDLFAVPEVT